MTKDTDKTYLSEYYSKIAVGNAFVLNVLKNISQTARQIDPTCPYGAHGVLSSLATYDFTPKEMEIFFRLCGNDVLKINAVDYCVFREKLDVKDLRKAIKNNFKGFNLTSHMQFAMRDSHRFSQYYNPKAPNPTAK